MSGRSAKALRRACAKEFGGGYRRVSVQYRNLERWSLFRAAQRFWNRQKSVPLRQRVAREAYLTTHSMYTNERGGHLLYDKHSQYAHEELRTAQR